MIETKEFKKALAKIIRSRGLERKGNSFFMRSDHATCVINLQISQWSPLIYVNWGLLLRELSDEQYPRESRCHIRFRAEHLDLKYKELLWILDLKHPMKLEERLGAFERILDTQIIPFSRRMLQPQEWKMLLNCEIRQIMIRKTVRDLAG